MDEAEDIFKPFIRQKSVGGRRKERRGIVRNDPVSIFNL